MITKTGQELLTKEAFSFRAIPAAARAFKSVFNKNYYGRAANNLSQNSFQPNSLMGSISAGFGASKKLMQSKRFGGLGHKPKSQGLYNWKPEHTPQFQGPIRKGQGSIKPPAQTAPQPVAPQTTSQTTPQTATPPINTSTTTQNPALPQGANQVAQPKGRSMLGKVGLGLTAASIPVGGYMGYQAYNSHLQQPHNQPQHFQQLTQPQYYR